MFILSHYEYPNNSNWYGWSQVNISDELKVAEYIQCFMNHNSNMIGFTSTYTEYNRVKKVHGLVSTEAVERLKRQFNTYDTEYITVIQESIIEGFKKWERLEDKDRKEIVFF